MAAPMQFRLFQSITKNFKYSPKCLEASFSTSTCSNNSSQDVATHTGQQWDENDRRLVRFENAPKQINSRFAIDLIAQVPPKKVESRIVACNGGGGPLGHPKVYINLDKPGNHICGYCGLRFVKPEDHHH
nr:EOG090X0NBY [Eurycercus lamellatus]